MIVPPPRPWTEGFVPEVKAGGWLGRLTWWWKRLWCRHLWLTVVRPGAGQRPGEVLWYGRDVMNYCLRCGDWRDRP